MNAKLRLLIPFFYFFAITCSCITIVHAQKQPGYTLLWEITGKGLKKPSYLFGAINIKDSRAYNFSDSLLIALSNTTAFALETHPDTTIKAMIKFGYTIPNAANIKTKLSEGASINNKQTLPNGYLYGLAKTYRKKMYGLDQFADSNKALPIISLDETTDETEQEEQQYQLEQLISVYTKGNLNEIWGEMQQYYEEGEFADRNQILTKELIALMQNETVFASVGIAFLPGEDGIISLLQKAGYQLRPVGASFTALQENYQIDPMQMDWYTFKDQNHHYSLKFPSIPHEYKHEDRAKIWAYVDPTTATLYRTTALYTGPLLNGTPVQYADTTLNELIKTTGYTLVEVKYAEKFGSTMSMAKLKKEGQDVYRYSIHVNGTFYTFTVIDYAGITAKKSIDLFFNSIQIDNPTAVNANQWISYTNDMAAFSIKLPTLPEESKKEFPNASLPESPYSLTYYMATDKVNLINYIVRYSDYPAGMYLIDKKVVFESVIKDFEQKGKLASEVRVISKDGYEGRAVDMIAANNYLEIEVYLRGNRIYMLLRQHMKGAVKAKKDQYFESFTFLPHLNNKGIPFTLGNIELTIPEKPIMLKKNSEDVEDDQTGTSFLANTQSYSVVNKNSGGLYGIEKNEISKYYKSKDLDTLYGLFVKQLTKDQRLIADKTVMVGTVKGRDFISFDSLANTTKRNKVWIQGNSFYLQTLIGTQQEIEGELSNAFFNVKVKETEPLFDIKRSKAELLTQDLASKNLETQKLALGALSFYEFEKEELPQVYAALTQNYTDDTSSTGTRIKLLNLLENLNNEQTPAFLKQLYHNNKGQDLIQSTILSVLPYVDSNSYSWYLKTLSEAPIFKLKNYWSLFTPLTDSLSFAAANIDQLVKLIAVNEYRPALLNLFSMMLNKDNVAIYKQLLESKKEMITKYALKDLEEDITKLAQDKYNINTYDYLTILPQLNVTALTDTYTQKVIVIDSAAHLHTQAVAARIKNGLAVSPSLLAAQLDSLSSRYLIMDAYRAIGKLNEVPLKYRKHEEFAKLLLHDYLVDEYETPVSINLLGAIKQGELTYYAFDFTYKEDNQLITYVGVCGPFNSKKDILDFESYYTLSNFDLKTKDWQQTAKALISEIE